jgi:hypothetical protein
MTHVAKDTAAIWLLCLGSIFCSCPMDSDYEWLTCETQWARWRWCESSLTQEVRMLPLFDEGGNWYRELTCFAKTTWTAVRVELVVIPVPLTWLMCKLLAPVLHRLLHPIASRPAVLGKHNLEAHGETSWFWYPPRSEEVGKADVLGVLGNNGIFGCGVKQGRQPGMIM